MDQHRVSRVLDNLLQMSTYCGSFGPLPLHVVVMAKEGNPVKIRSRPATVWWEQRSYVCHWSVVTLIGKERAEEHPAFAGETPKPGDLPRHMAFCHVSEPSILEGGVVALFYPVDAHCITR